MTSMDTLKPSADVVMKEIMRTDLQEILDEIEMTPDAVFVRMGTTKVDMLREANKTLKAVEAL